MIRLAILVEGQTEEEFVKSVLADHLRGSGLEPTPVLIGRGRGAGGGNVGVERLTMDMSRLYWKFDAVTSLVDYYGFRGKGTRTVDELEEDLIEQIQRRIAHRWDARKIIPYVQRHEFEGLLFSDVNAFSNAIDVPENSVEELRRIRADFPTPEDINDSRDTAPSKRIQGTIRGYKKVVDGPLLAMEIGLAAIRAECRRFDRWVTRLESVPTVGGATTVEVDA